MLWCAGHYILQLEQAHRPDHSQPKLMEVQHIPNEMLQLGPPLFKLAGLAIGNGLTDPKLQVPFTTVCHCCLNQMQDCTLNRQVWHALLVLLRTHAISRGPFA